MSGAALEVREIRVRYRDVVAVHHATVTVAGGGLAALVGPSGCGKTSLLRSIAGFEAPESGTISLGETLLFGPDTFVAPERRRIGMVFQEGALFPHLTVLENVEFGLRSGERERAVETLRLVGLETLGHRRPHELSGGQQQRVALARALAPRPRLILLDEPFGGLDAALRVRLRDEVREILRATGTTAVLVTHDQEEALSIAEQISVMHQGKILQTGSPRSVYEEPAVREVSLLIGDSHLLNATVRNGRVDTPLGPLRVDAPDGACSVRVGSEDVMIAENAEGAYAKLVASHFFGHDVVDEFELDDGTRIRVRLPRSSGDIGDARRLAFRSSRMRVFLEDGSAVTAVVHDPAQS